MLTTSSSIVAVVTTGVIYYIYSDSTQYLVHSYLLVTYLLEVRKRWHLAGWLADVTQFIWRDVICSWCRTAVVMWHLTSRPGSLSLVADDVVNLLQNTLMA